MKRILFITLLFIGSAVLLSWNLQLFIIPPVFLTIFFIHPKAFHLFLKWKFDIFILLLLFGIPLLLGEKNATVLGIPYSYEYFQKSLVMVNRSLIILLSIRMFTGKISPEQLSLWLKKLHLHNFSEVLSISMGVLPELKAITHKSFREARLSPRNINILKRLFKAMVRFMVQILSFADHYHQDQHIERKKFK
jgi:hypothetical protein